MDTVVKTETENCLHYEPLVTALEATQILNYINFENIYFSYLEELQKLPENNSEPKN